ncbi:hypothetical protein J437_LFUL006477 [Ladona fulva]|uniref:Uncharacterized protein n=1 Tax=Ladona fulva TaxID=123851 RepID=A0A8K0P1P2_LADFU|nr:hypothetical protein J437_LFUL006477 [Ladona fulva]
MPAAEVLIRANGVDRMADNIINNNSPVVRYSPPKHLPTLAENGKFAREERHVASAFAETTTSWNPELMSGSLTLLGPVNKHSQSVQVKVYRTSLEHFAVVYPQKKVCRPLGVLNLKNAHVERLGGETTKKGDEKDGETLGFVVRQRGFDSPFCLTFLLEAPYASPYFPFSAAPKRDLAKDLEQWMEAFRSSPSPPTSPQRSRRCATASKHPSCLAVVEEEEV